jgi:cytochrome P450
LPAHGETGLEALPPGPEVPAAWQTLRWLGKPYELLEECADEFGDAFTLDLGSHGCFAMFSAPDAIRTIFTADTTIAHAGKGHLVLMPLLGPRSILLLDEQRHARERRLLMPSFHVKRVETFGPLIQRETASALARFSAGQEVVLHDVMQEVSLDVILRAVFGVREERTADLAREIRRWLDDVRLNMGLLHQLRDEASSETFRAFQAGLERIDRIIYDEIAERRARSDPGRDDVMSVLLGARYEDGAPLDDAALRDELVTLLMAGYETTATALAWALCWIHADVDVARRLRDELARLGPDPSASALAEGAPYLQAVCYETLRVYPILPIVARQLQAPLSVGGRKIPAGVNVAACIYLAHRRPAAFPEPDRFQPERFLSRAYSPYEYLPFGGGSRRCLGMTLALLEMKVVLGTMLASLELDLEGRPVRPVRRSVTIAPSGGALMRVRAVRSDATRSRA